ncbi:MAG: MFS transporter, partial [Anaerolinea sp.]
MEGLLSAYYGWRIVGALAITQLVSWGILYYAFSVVLLPMQLDTGWDTAAITGAFSLGLVIGGVAALPIGRLLDRFGARQIMSLGSVASVLLVIAWSQVRTLTDLYIVWSLLGVSMACVLYEPAFAVIARWFQKRRAQALTAVTIGGGLASVVFVPLTNALVTAGGWREALVALAVVLALITIPLHVLVLRRHPSDLGLQVDGGRVKITTVEL